MTSPAFPTHESPASLTDPLGTFAVGEVCWRSGLGGYLTVQGEVATEARGVAASGVLREGASQPLSEPRGPYHALWGLHLEATPFITAWVCWNRPAWDFGCDCSTVKEYVPVCLLPTPPQHRCESAQVRKLTHLPHLALEKGLLSLPFGLE